MNTLNENSLKGLFRFLSFYSPGRTFFSIVTGLMSGLGYALVIPLIMLSVESEETLLVTYKSGEEWFLGDFEITQPGFLLAFVALCLFILLTRVISQIVFNNVVIQSTSLLRQYAVKRISLLPIEALERIGEDKLMVAFTLDVPRIANGAAVYPQLLNNLTSILGILGFLLLLDADVFLLVTVFILVGMITYRIPVFVGRRYLVYSRNLFDRIQEGFSGAIKGAKELKLNRRKREVFIGEKFAGDERAFTRLQMRGQSLILAANNYGGLISFFAIGFITYALSNYLALTKEVLLASIMAVLYASGPVNTIMNIITPMILGNVSLRKIRSLLARMPEERSAAGGAVDEFSRLELCDIHHRYGDEGAFAIGPVNITLKEGEVTFITGGNGSGKSTLAKIISGHYIPRQGRILFDGNLVDDENRDEVRQHISAIYTDFYLFRSLLGLTPEKEKLARHYLDKLDISQKVNIENGAYSTVDLSDGQRKRLALVASYLEDRKVYLFDEWAADQDPYFREVFYLQILPELKQRGKIVVVISHDDKYFSQADQLIKMETGVVINSERKKMPDAVNA